MAQSMELKEEHPCAERMLSSLLEFLGLSSAEDLSELTDYDVLEKGAYYMLYSQFSHMEVTEFRTKQLEGLLSRTRREGMVTTLTTTEGGDLSMYPGWYNSTADHVEMANVFGILVQVQKKQQQQEEYLADLENTREVTKKETVEGVDRMIEKLTQKRERMVRNIDEQYDRMYDKFSEQCNEVSQILTRLEQDIAKRKELLETNSEMNLNGSAWWYVRKQMMDICDGIIGYTHDVVEDDERFHIPQNPQRAAGVGVNYEWFERNLGFFVIENSRPLQESELWNYQDKIRGMEQEYRAAVKRIDDARQAEMSAIREECEHALHEREKGFEKEMTEMEERLSLATLVWCWSLLCLCLENKQPHQNETKKELEQYAQSESRSVRLEALALMNFCLLNNVGCNMQFLHEMCETPDVQEYMNECLRRTSQLDGSSGLMYKLTLSSRYKSRSIGHTFEALTNEDDLSTGAATNTASDQWIQATLHAPSRIQRVTVGSPGAYNGDRRQAMTGGWNQGHINGCVFQFEDLGTKEWRSLFMVDQGRDEIKQYTVDITTRCVRMFRKGNGYVGMSVFKLNSR